MADVHDIARAIAAALDEIGVSGEVIVNRGEETSHLTLGSPLGDLQEITVEVKDDGDRFEGLRYRPINPRRDPAGLLAFWENRHGA